VRSLNTEDRAASEAAILNRRRRGRCFLLFGQLDPKLVRRFLRLMQRTKAKVVLSSTWRYDPAGIFSAKHSGIPFIGVSLDMSKRPRRDEVPAWLKSRSLRGRSGAPWTDRSDRPGYDDAGEAHG
jgi:HAD domain in Swiss Army Knife RNA repair proteins